MPNCCAIAGCLNWRGKSKSDSSDVNISYHRFPKDEVLCKTWINRCCRKDLVNLKNALICSVHFEESCFERDFRNELLGLPIRRILQDDALPTKCLPYKKSPKKSPGRTNRARKRQAKRSLDEIRNSDPCEQLHDQLSTSTAENGKNCQQCERLQAEKNDLQAQCDSLRRKLKDLKMQRLCERRSLNARIKYWRQLNKSGARSSVKDLPGNVQRMFSSGDMKCLRREKKSARWSEEDLEALDLRTVRSSGNTTLFENNGIRYSL